MSEHKYADIFRALADNKEILGRMPGGNWVVMKEPWRYIGSIEWELRVKVPTIFINGIEVPEPVRNPLVLGQRYWLVRLDVVDMTTSHSWQNDLLDHLYLKRELIQLTQQDAMTQAKATLGLFVW